MEYYYFDNTDEHVKELTLQSFSICRNKISKQYIQYVLENFDIGWMHIAMIGQKRKKQKNIIYSFVLCRIVDKCLFLELVCNKENNKKNEGAELIRKVEEYAKENNINTILINSVSELVEYYTKLGYKKGGRFEQKDDIVYQMCKSI